MARRIAYLAVVLLSVTLPATVASPQGPDVLGQARETVLRQLEAFRRDDFDGAYTFASASIKQQFDRAAFERMVRGGYPEIARSARAAVTRAEVAANGHAYLELRIRGANGQRVEAIYELVWENGGWKVNGVATRPDPGEDASARPPVVRVAAAGQRVGVLGPDEDPRFTELARGLRQGLREARGGGPSVDILEARVARGDRKGWRAAVERLRRERASVLFVIGSELARAARQVAAEPPLVFITPGDPVASGLVRSLARPGGNMTGMTFEYPELSAKRLEILKEIDGRIRRVVVLHDSRDASSRQHLAAAGQAATALGIRLVEREARSREELARALPALDGADAFLALPGGFPAAYLDEAVAAASTRRIPSIVPGHGAPGAALARYGASEAETARQAARLVERILRGARAGDLPVERPTTLRLVLNGRTARILGLTIPPALLQRADEIVQ